MMPPTADSFRLVLWSLQYNRRRRQAKAVFAFVFFSSAVEW